MYKHLKLTLIIIFSAIAILAIAGYVFLSTQDYSYLKGRLETAVTDATGRKFAVAGDFTLSISLTPEFVINDLTLANASWGSEPAMLTIGKLEVGVKLLPLITGNLEFTGIQFITTGLLLETDAKGRGNWQFTAPGKTSTGFKIKHLGMKYLNLEQLAVTFNDGKTQLKEKYQIHSLDLKRAFNTDKLAMDAKASFKGLPVTLSGHTGLLVNLFNDVEFPVTLNGSVAGMSLDIQGKITDVQSPQGLDLSVQASGTDLTPLGTAIDVVLPKTDAFKLKAHFAGNGDIVTTSGIQLNLNNGGTQFEVTGDIGNLKALENIKLALTGSGKNLAALGAIIDKTLPETGPFNVSGTLTGSAKAPSLSDAQCTISHGDVKLALSGKVNDVIALTGIDLNLKGSGNNLHELQAFTETKLPGTGPFSVSGTLNGTARTLALRNMHATVTQEKSKLEISGTVADLQRLDGIDLDFKGSGKDFTDLGPMFDAQLPDLGPFQIRGQLAGTSDVLHLKNVSAMIDQSDLNGAGQLTFGKRPRISMKLESGLIDFTRLMGEGEKESEQDTNQTKTKDSKSLAFSDKPLHLNRLDSVDADITLNARSIKARDASLELGKLALQLDAGHLRVNTLEATYKNTRISANLNVKSETPPDVAVKFLVQDFDLGSFLKEIHKTQEISGHLDIAVDLRSQGDSPHGLMAALDGSFGIVTGKGHMPRILDFLAEDLSKRVIPIWGRHQHAGEVNCGVIQFSIAKGIATSQAFLLNSQLGLLKGDGDINFGTEQINFLLSPKPKKASLISLSTKLRVTGSIQDPRVKTDKEALLKKGAKGLAALVVGPVGLLAPFVKMGARNKHPCDIQKLKSTVDAIYN